MVKSSLRGGAGIANTVPQDIGVHKYSSVPTIKQGELWKGMSTGGRGAMADTGARGGTEQVC